MENPLDSAQHPDSFAGKGSGTVAFNKANCIVQHSNGAGIWQPAYFEATGPVTIRNVRITPALPDKARVEVELEGEKPGEVTVAVGPADFKGQPIAVKLELKAGQKLCVLDVQLPAPRTEANHLCVRIVFSSVPTPI